MNEMIDFNRKLVNECLMKMKDKNILDLSDNGGIHKNNSFKDQFMRMQAEAKNNTKTGLDTGLDKDRGKEQDKFKEKEKEKEKDKEQVERKLIQPAIDLEDDDNLNNSSKLTNKNNDVSDIKLFEETKLKDNFVIIKNYSE